MVTLIENCWKVGNDPLFTGLAGLYHLLSGFHAMFSGGYQTPCNYLFNLYVQNGSTQTDAWITLLIRLCMDGFLEHARLPTNLIQVAPYGLMALQQVL
jgi:hypothetical protein